MLAENAPRATHNRKPPAGYNEMAYYFFLQSVQLWHQLDSAAEFGAGNNDSFSLKTCFPIIQQKHIQLVRTKWQTTSSSKE